MQELYLILLIPVIIIFFFSPQHPSSTIIYACPGEFVPPRCDVFTEEPSKCLFLHDPSFQGNVVEFQSSTPVDLVCDHGHTFFSTQKERIPFLPSATTLSCRVFPKTPTCLTIHPRGMLHHCYSEKTGDLLLGK